MHTFYNRWWWRLTIDAVVVLSCIGVAIYLWAPADEWVPPDDIAELDAAMAAYVIDAPTVRDVSDSLSVTAAELASLVTTDQVIPVSVPELYAAVQASTVYLYADSPTAAWHGTGVVLTPTGLVATNAHVIDEADKLAIATVGGGALYPITELVYIDYARDLAIVRADLGSDSLPPLPIRTTAPVIGEAVYTVGHPEGFLYSLSSGVVSGTRTFSGDGSGANIQVTTPISAGSSGGPLVDASGALLGVMTWSLEYAENVVSVQNLNFAIPAPQFIEALRSVSAE